VPEADVGKTADQKKDEDKEIANAEKDASEKSLKKASKKGSKKDEFSVEAAHKAIEQVETGEAEAEEGPAEVAAAGAVDDAVAEAGLEPEEEQAKPVRFFKPSPEVERKEKDLSVLEKIRAAKRK